jgi:hypothetical protein
MARVIGARLALEDLAAFVFEGSDPNLSLFRRRADRSLHIAGARLGVTQQESLSANLKGGVAIHGGSPQRPGS